MIIMEVKLAERHFESPSKITSELNMNIFSTKELAPSSHDSLSSGQDNTDILNKKTNYEYGELTPSSSPSTSEVYSSYEAEESSASKSEIRPVLQESSASSNVCSEYMGDVSEDENCERPQNTKLYQRYKKSKLVHRNVTSSYLYRKRNADLCSSSDENDVTISGDDDHSKFKKMHKRLKRRTKSRKLPRDENSVAITMKENGDKPTENMSPQEVVSTSITETIQQPLSQPFVNKSVLSRSYQRANVDENTKPIDKDISNNINDSYMSQQQRDFHETANRGDGMELIRLLQKTGNTVNINLIDTEGQTALHKSIMTGNFELVKILVNYGANTRLANRDGWTALHMAAHAGHANILVYLFSNLR